MDDDVANCVTEMICKDPDVAECASEEKIPKRSCTVDQETNKKVQKMSLIYSYNINIQLLT